MRGDGTTGSSVANPVPVPTDGHLLVAGKTGCGKSWLVLNPLVAERLRAGHYFVLFNLAGEPAMYHQMRLVCAALGRRFRFVSTDPAFDTEFVDVLQEQPFRLSSIQLTGTILEGCGIHRGLGKYGAEYFADAMAAPALQVVQSLRDQRIPTDWATVTEHVRRTSASQKHMEHLAHATQIISHFRCIAEPGPAHKRVRWSDVVDNAECLYIHAPTLGSPLTVKACGAVLQSLVSYLQVRFDRSGEAKPGTIAIDEAAWMVRAQRASDLTNVRKLGVRFALFIQSLEQLDVESKATGQIILDNCDTSVWMSPYSEREVAFIQSHSADAKYWLESHTTEPAGTSVSRREDRDYRVTRDDILRVARTKQMAIVVRRGEGTEAEPIPVWADFTIPLHVFRQLERMPLIVDPETWTAS